MTALEPLETLYELDNADAVELPVPPLLRELHGPLRFSSRLDRPHVIANFVISLDGVTSLGIPGKAGGGPISGNNEHDRLVMGILRAVSDAVIVGAGTLRAVPNHVWSPEYIYPPLHDIYAALRSAIGKAGPPLNVIVTSGGNIDLDLPVFKSLGVEVLIVTTEPGAGRIRRLSGRSPHVRIHSVDSAGPRLSAQAILEAVGAVRRCERILVEGGPQLIGDFFAEGCLDELFLTQSPQIAGRNGAGKRPGLVAGKIFAPDRPLWGRLVGIKRARNHLFVRYSF
jgi:riboflavin biosynthesis pyrimidine reductase